MSREQISSEISKEKFIPKSKKEILYEENKEKLEAAVEFHWQRAKNGIGPLPSDKDGRFFSNIMDETVATDYLSEIWEKYHQGNKDNFLFWIAKINSILKKLRENKDNNGILIQGRKPSQRQLDKISKERQSDDSKKVWEDARKRAGYENEPLEDFIGEDINL